MDFVSFKKLMKLKWYEQSKKRNSRKYIKFNNNYRIINNLTMKKEGKWLKNDFIKIKNPSIVHENSINIECSIENFNFSTKFSTNGQIDKPNRYMFVIDSIDSPVVWYKYDSYNKCGCQNKLFFGKNKTTVQQWYECGISKNIEFKNIFI